MPIQIIPISSGNFSQVVRKHGPDMPSLDTLLSQDRKCTEDTAIHRVAAITPDGEIVGFGFAVTGPWDPILRPGYMEEKSRPELEQMRNLLFEKMDPAGSILILDGEKWVAMSLVIRETEEVYYNSLTGVCRPYRGKRLSLAAKVKAAEFAKNQGAKYLRTHNDSNNERILAVNRKMGYKPKPGIFFLTRSIHHSST